MSTLNPFPIMETAILRQAKHLGWETPPHNPHEAHRHRCRRCAAIPSTPRRRAWRERDTGSLSPGKHADLIVLDRDIFAIPAQELFDTKVLTTMLGGQGRVQRLTGVSG